MDDNKKRLSYNPDINYKEDYYSDGTRLTYDDEDFNYNEETYDDTTMDNIQENIDHLVQVIPLLPIEIQTMINQVFKPVFNDWYSNLKGKHYPLYIPEPGKTIIKPKPPQIPEDGDKDTGGGDTGGGGDPGDTGGGKDPGGGGGDPGGDGGDPGDTGGGDPGGGGGDPGDTGGKDPSDTGGRDPGDTGGGKDPGDTGGGKEPSDTDRNPSDTGGGKNPSDTGGDPGDGKLPSDDDGLFEPSVPFDIQYVKIDPGKLVELEYVKNAADTYLNYTRDLKNAVDKFLFKGLSSIIASNNATGRNDAENFLFNNLNVTSPNTSNNKGPNISDDTTDSDNTPGLDEDTKLDNKPVTNPEDYKNFLTDDLTIMDANVADNVRHLIDLAVRGEINGLLKMQFSLNVFTLENTLYHLKNYKVTKDLRARYETEEMKADGSYEGSKSDRMLAGLRQQYDKNYDTSYINLYKHLNSSVIVLEDVLNTLLLAVASKEILFKDGGSAK